MCAFLFSESLERLLHTRYVGVIYLKIWIVLLSSISNTAISFVFFPVIVLLFTKLAAIPVFIFEPYLLLITLYPLSSSTSLIMLDTVVFPLVPVTPIIIGGLSICSRKLGHIFNAKFPGKYDAFLLSNFRDLFAHFAKNIAV